MEQTTNSKQDLKVYQSASELLSVNSLSASFVIAMSLDIHHSFEVVVLKIDLDEYPISGTVHLQLSVEVLWHRWLCWNWT